ncbi:hypothetical protein C8R46DRAFT_1194629 [Mycena filopes]|nr:hypothetical protein C8R46DRAFT_1194629 [Mycena filopes]
MTLTFCFPPNSNLTPPPGTPNPFAPLIGLVGDAPQPALSSTTNSAAGDSWTGIPQLVVSALFLDNLAKDFDLTAAQRNHLYTFAQLGSVNEGLSKPDLSTRLFSVVLFFVNVNERARLDDQARIEDLTQLLEDLRVRLDDGYIFTREQTKNIRTQAQDTIYEATRTSFIMMHVDVIQKLRDNKTSMKLNGVFGNPSREKSLISLVKKICSSVRNSFRQDIRNSICGDSPATLASFTYSSATKFKRGGPGLNLDVGFTIHNALLVRRVYEQQKISANAPPKRRFAIENPGSIGVEEVDDDDDSTEDGSLAPVPKKRKHRNASHDDDDGESPAPSKKRKLGPTSHAGGRIPKGKDFWSLVDAFFARQITKFGSKNLQSAGWKEYTSETVHKDENLFPDVDDIEIDVPVPSTSRTGSSVAGGSSPSFMSHL